MCAYKDYITEDDLNRYCSNNSSYYGNSDAEKTVDNILDYVGLYRNFTIKECPNISNAIAATVINSYGSYDRYIIYDKSFLERVNGVTGTDWASISIMAHEIGHHLNGHTLINGMNSHSKELQADEFSGFVLGKMGATLNEALKAINELGDDNSSNSHPNKFLRINSITKN